MAVLIKGKSITCSQRSRDHYLRGKENDLVAVREILGFATLNPDEALQMIELSAKGTRCEKPVYSAKVNPEPDRLWTEEEVRRAVELLEENLGLKGHPRVVIEHNKHGRVHYHVLWSRFHPGGGPAKNMGNDYALHQNTQSQIEKEFKLRPMRTKGRDFQQSEIEWAKRYGFDIFNLRKEITKDFNKTKSGQDFMAALKAKGCVLCRGDKSQFVLILPWGQHKALSSMIHGRPIKAVLRRALSDIDITKLPTVSEGKAQIRATLPKIKKAPRGATRIASTYIRSRPAHIAPRTKPYRPQTSMPIHGPVIKVASKPTKTSKPESWRPPEPTRPDTKKKGWPEAAIIAWEIWGHKNPPLFFSIWTELAPVGFEL
jgi:hypothetical protein